MDYNDLYNYTIEFRGTQYRYDPDQDLFYPIRTESAPSKYAWIIVTVLLAALCWYIEYARL